MPYRYIAFNKPYDVLSQFTPEHGSRSLEEFGLPKEVYPAGRLDKDSEGLLLLTDDGPFIKKLLESHPRCYWAQVEHIPTEEALGSLRKGVQLNWGKTLPAQAKLIDPPPLWERVPPIRKRQRIPTAWVELCLTEGKNRQVRKMTAAVGHPTLRLVRCRIGKLTLSNLKLLPGQWKSVDRREI